MRARSALKWSTHTHATFSNALKISTRKMVIRSSLVCMKKSVLPFFNFEWCVKFITKPILVTLHGFVSKGLTLVQFCNGLPTLYCSFTHPLRFNVWIHSIRTTNTWYRCLLSATRQFTKLSIVKLSRLRFLPAIQRKTCCSWTKQTIEGISLTAVPQKQKHF